MVEGVHLVNRKCAKCGKLSLQVIGPVTHWALDPPPIDAEEYRLWRCTIIYEGIGADGKIYREACGFEVKAKDDGSYSRDPRYSKILGVGEDRTP